MSKNITHIAIGVLLTSALSSCGGPSSQFLQSNVAPPVPFLTSCARLIVGEVTATGSTSVPGMIDNLGVRIVGLDATNLMVAFSTGYLMNLYLATDQLTSSAPKPFVLGEISADEVDYYQLDGSPGQFSRGTLGDDDDESRYSNISRVVKEGCPVDPSSDHAEIAITLGPAAHGGLRSYLIVAIADGRADFVFGVARRSLGVMWPHDYSSNYRTP